MVSYWRSMDHLHAYAKTAVLPLLARLPLRELGPVLVPHLETGEEWLSVHDLLLDRNDPPDALLEAAAELGDRSTASRALRSLFALLAIGGGPPGEVAVPRDHLGAPFVHLLTIDARDAPEIERRYPKAGALAVVTAEEARRRRGAASPAARCEAATPWTSLVRD